MSDISVVSPEDQSVTFVELFFDLVFVFSVTQIVRILHDGITWQAVAEGVLVFWLVWWAWTQFTWALNAANADHRRVQLKTLLATGVAFFMAVSVPAAFGAGALWFAVPYVLVRIIGLSIYWWVAADAGHRTAVRIFATMSATGLIAVFVGAVIGGSLQYWIWGAAILLDVVAAERAGREETWNLHPVHFVERHGLIVIIALGESLIVAAAGLTAAPTDPNLVVVGLLCVGLACALWWSYFPRVRPALEHALAAVSGARQSTLARDAFSLAHFPMLCGIVAVAVSIEEAILHPADPMLLQGRLALASGLVLFVGGSGVAAWRALGRILLARWVIPIFFGLATVVLGWIPPSGSLALGILSLLAVVVVEGRSPV
jgi:low temperature requirement protein LtrA